MDTMKQLGISVSGLLVVVAGILLLIYTQGDNIHAELEPRPSFSEADEPDPGSESPAQPMQSEPSEEPLLNLTAPPDAENGI